MTYQIRWTKQGWHVVSSVGSCVVQIVGFDSYTEALESWIRACGGCA